MVPRGAQQTPAAVATGSAAAAGMGFVVAVVAAFILVIRPVGAA
jgi:hypothetical protein